MKCIPAICFRTPIGTDLVPEIVKNQTQLIVEKKCKSPQLVFENMVSDFTPYLIYIILSPPRQTNIVTKTCIYFKNIARIVQW